MSQRNYYNPNHEFDQAASFHSHDAKSPWMCLNKSLNTRLNPSHVAKMKELESMTK